MRSDGLLLVMITVGASALGVPARPAVPRTSSSVDMSEIRRRDALVAAAVLASVPPGTPANAAYAYQLSNVVASIDAAADERNTQGKPSKHTPIVTTRSKRFAIMTTVEFTVPHIMDAKIPHFIQYMWLKDSKSGDVLAVKEFQPATQAEPSMAASISRGRSVTPMVYCNLHGLWEGESVAL